MTLDQLQEYCLAHNLAAEICGDSMTVSFYPADNYNNADGPSWLELSEPLPIRA